MATETQIIDKIRRRVADYTEERRYDNTYYVDAIEFAIDKLNFDFDETYIDVADVPSTRIFLLIKLSTIEMCYIRASEGAEAEGTEGAETRYTQVSVPDLSVQDTGQGISRGPAYWLDLARRLQDEYDGEVGENKAGQNVGGIVEVDVVRRISLRNGGYIKRKLDPGLPAVTLATPTVVGNDVTLSWSKLVREDFSYYLVVRSDTATFTTETQIRYESDIHETSWIDESVSAGTWYYKVKSVNPNELETDSNVVSAVVS